MEGAVKNVAVPASAYMEYELILRSRGVSDEEIAEDIEAFKQIRNLDEIPLTASIITEAPVHRRAPRLRRGHGRMLKP